MNLDIRQCGPRELPAIIDKLDQEFVFGKKRSLSLRHRFPGTLSENNIEQIHVAMSDGLICGAYAIRIFDWVAEELVWHGAMIGMVWVAPDCRGKGVGTQLMLSAKSFLLEKKLDFGVLWTGTQAFYERAGWFANDRGLFCEMARCSKVLGVGVVGCRPLSSVDATWLESMRSKFQPVRVLRSPLDYRTMPIPALDVYCFSAKNDDGSEGFALVGDWDNTGYFYEMTAPPCLWGAIWSAVTGRFDRLLVNGHSGDSFSQWLTEKKHIVWRPQNKAMWLRLSRRIENAPLNTWHIPYFDWI